MYYISLTPLLIAFLFQIISLESGWNSPMDDKQLKKKQQEKKLTLGCFIPWSKILI